MGLNTLLTAATLLASASHVLATLPPIKLNGKDFVDSKSGQRFAVVGVDYQPGGSAQVGTGKGDPLSNNDDCLRDAVLMQQLGVNTIRCYNIDPTLNHDTCMSTFDAAGIYVILDVNTGIQGQNIDQTNPSGAYTKDYLTHVFSVIDAFKAYDNLLGFFAGNEIINDVPTGKDNPPYIRAVQRDMKNYIAKQAKRAIPVGYSAADVREILPDQWNYLQCDNGDNSRADFFGLNSYSWCGGDATFTSAGYDVLVDLFAATSIPIFFSEYGCNAVRPRVFNEVQAIYGPQMTTLNGGLVYEYTQEENNYGLVSINSNGSANLLGDYYNLANQYNKIDLSVIQTANSTAENIKSPKCSSSLIKTSGFSKSFNIPSAPDGVAALISGGVSGSQKGSYVSVTATSVKQPVYSTNGVALKDLVLKFNTGSNIPSGAKQDSVSTTGSAATPSASKKGAASKPVALIGPLFAGLIAAAAIAL